MDHVNNSPATPDNQEQPHGSNTGMNSPSVSNTQTLLPARRAGNSEALASVGLAPVYSRPYQVSEELVPSPGDRMSSQHLPTSAMGGQGRAVNSAEPRHGMEMSAERPTLGDIVQGGSLPQTTHATSEASVPSGLSTEALLLGYFTGTNRDVTISSLPNSRSSRTGFNFDEARREFSHRLQLPVGLRPGSLAPPSLNNVPLADQENITPTLVQRLQENQEREDRENSVIRAFVQQNTTSRITASLDSQLPRAPDTNPVPHPRPLNPRRTVGLNAIPLNSNFVPIYPGQVGAVHLSRHFRIPYNTVATPTAMTMNSAIGPHMATQTDDGSNPYSMSSNISVSTNTTQTSTSRDMGTDPVSDNEVLPRKRRTRSNNIEEEHLPCKRSRLEDKYYEERLLRQRAQEEASSNAILLAIKNDEILKLTGDISTLREKIQQDANAKTAVSNAYITQKHEANILRFRYENEKKLTADLRDRLSFKLEEEWQAQRKIERANRETNKREEECKKVRELNAKLTSSAPQREIANLDKQLKELQMTRDVLNSNRNFLIEQNKRLESDIKKKDTTIRDIEMENVTLTESVEYLTQQEKELKSTVAQLENELYAMRRENEALRNSSNNSQRQLVIFDEILEAFDQYQESAFVVPYNTLLKIMLLRLDARDPFFNYFNMQRLTFGDQIRMTNSFANLWTEVVSLADALYPEYATNPMRDEDGNIIPLSNVADMKRWLNQEGSFDPSGLINRLFDNYYRLKQEAREHRVIQEANGVLLPEPYAAFPYEPFSNPHNAVIDSLVEMNRLRGELELEALEEEAIENTGLSGDEMEMAFEEIRNSYDAQMRNIDAVMNAHEEAELEDQEDQEDQE